MVMGIVSVWFSLDEWGVSSSDNGSIKFDLVYSDGPSINFNSRKYISILLVLVGSFRENSQISGL